MASVARAREPVMPREIYFPPVEPSWEFDRDAVRFYAVVDQNTLVCRVSVEALMRHFGVRSLDARESLDAFMKHRAAIEAATRRRIEYELAMEPSVREINLSISDFGTPKTSRLATTLDNGLVHDSELLAAVKKADTLLEEHIARSKLAVVVAWSAIPAIGKQMLLGLRLTEPDTKATVNTVFTREDLRNETHTRFALFRLWDDLLRERARLQVKAIQEAGPVGV
ncbi:MAG: DUF1488 domain-containing protein [Gemmataceae bacterium]|nr:DUF1488 domain-containing protein [Gemmataceae bacterium]